MKNSFAGAKIIYESNNSIGKLLSSSKEFDVVHLTINPNSKIDAHSISQKIKFFVIDGYGTIDIDGTRFELNCNDMISVDPNLERSWTNNTNSDLVLLGIKLK